VIPRPVLVTMVPRYEAWCVVCHKVTEHEAGVCVVCHPEAASGAGAGGDQEVEPEGPDRMMPLAPSRLEADPDWRHRARRPRGES